METKYPTLKRPKRKLCYDTIMDSQPKRWTGNVTLDDVDKMFDDLDPVQCDLDIVPPSPELQINLKQNKELQVVISPITQVPTGEHLPPSVVSTSLDLDIDSDFPFKVHETVKTSSPIEDNGLDVNKGQNKKHKIISPILFDCEDEGKEAQPKPPPVQETHQNGDLSEACSPVLEHCPSKMFLTKSYKKKKVDTQQKDNTAHPVSLVQRKSRVAAPEKPSAIVQKQQQVEMPTRVKKDMNAFLQKFREQPKSTRGRMPSSQVKIPSPPREPDDNFVILEDDTPLLFSIPRKVATNKRQEQNTTSATNKDKKTEGDSEETTKKQPGSEQEKSKSTNQVAKLLTCSQNIEDTPVSHNQKSTLRKTKQSNKESAEALASLAKPSRGRSLRMQNQKRSPATSSQQRQKTTESKARCIRNESTGRASTGKKKATHKESHEQEPEVPDEDVNGGRSSPMVCPQWNHSIDSGDKVFKSSHPPVSDERMPAIPASASHSKPLAETEAKVEKRKRRSPGNWWQVNPTPKDVESSSSDPLQLPLRGATRQKERNTQQKKKSLVPRSPKSRPATASSRPPGGAHVPPVEQQLSRCSPALISSAAQAPSVITRGNIGQKKKRNSTARTAEESVQVLLTDGNVTNMDASQSRRTEDCPPSYESSQENMCKSLRSGLYSVIPLQQYEEEEDSMLPSSRVTPAALCASDLCAPPLKPLILQPNDKATMAEWLKTVWSTGMNNSGTEITPDHFDWYFYQGRAIGFMVDLQSESICTGKILLGSFMKKPLWVDHSATSVFNVLTSAVNVTVDCNETQYNPGQSFLVSCGHAYSVQNLSAQPAVLYFTRVLAEDV